MRAPDHKSLLALALLAGCAAAPHATVIGRSLTQLLAPIPGSEPYIARAAGHVVLVDVWASWCRSCDVTLGLDADLQRDLGREGLVVVTVNVDADSRAADAFTQRLGLSQTMAVLRDLEARQVEAEFDITRLPAAFAIDRRGIVRRVESGYSASGRARLRQTLADLLREP